MIKGFIILMQFMTRIPIPVNVEYDEEKLGKSVKYFPLVGAIIGVFLFAVNFLTGKITGNRQIIAIALIIAEILITGLMMGWQILRMDFSVMLKRKKCLK